MSSAFHETGIQDNLKSSEYIVHGQISTISGRNFVEHITMVPNIAVVLFSNRLKFLAQQSRLTCNEWLNFNIDAGYAQQLIELHARFNKLFSRWFDEWFIRTEEENHILDIILRILQEEDVIEKRIRFARNDF